MVALSTRLFSFGSSVLLLALSCFIYSCFLQRPANQKDYTIQRDLLAVPTNVVNNLENKAAARKSWEYYSSEQYLAELILQVLGKPKTEEGQFICMNVGLGHYRHYAKEWYTRMTEDHGCPSIFVAGDRASLITGRS